MCTRAVPCAAFAGVLLLDLTLRCLCGPCVVLCGATPLQLKREHQALLDSLAASGRRVGTVTKRQFAAVRVKTSTTGARKPRRRLKSLKGGSSGRRASFASTASTGSGGGSSRRLSIASDASADAANVHE